MHHAVDPLGLELLKTATGFPAVVRIAASRWVGPKEAHRLPFGMGCIELGVKVVEDGHLEVCLGMKD